MGANASAYEVGVYKHMNKRPGSPKQDIPSVLACWRPLGRGVAVKSIRRPVNSDVLAAIYKMIVDLGVLEWTLLCNLGRPWRRRLQVEPRP